MAGVTEPVLSLLLCSAAVRAAKRWKRSSLARVLVPGNSPLPLAV